MSLQDELICQLRQLTGELQLRPDEAIKLRPLGENSSVADGASHFLVNTDWIVKLSPSSFPQVAVQEAASMAAAKAALGPSLGRWVLDVQATGFVDERSFIVLPVCSPMSPY